MFSLDTPKTWERMPIDTQTKTECVCHLFDLKTSSEEFVKVQRNLAATVNAKKIISIQRVQNTMLYGQYIARKKAMEILNPPGTNNERLLFHGTSADTIPKINSQGFNRTFAGKNGNLSCSIHTNADFTQHIPPQQLLMVREFTSLSMQATLLVQHILHLMLMDTNTCILFVY